MLKLNAAGTFLPFCSFTIDFQPQPVQNELARAGRPAGQLDGRLAGKAGKNLHESLSTRSVFIFVSAAVLPEAEGRGRAEKTKQAKDFAKEQVTSIVEETPISMPTPRRTIPSPEQISMSGPAQQMSANIGNVERDIALGAAGNNPTMQALLRARGQG